MSFCVTRVTLGGGVKYIFWPVFGERIVQELCVSNVTVNDRDARMLMHCIFGIFIPVNYNYLLGIKFQKFVCESGTNTAKSTCYKAYATS
jgi:hypothetical protein